MRAHLAGGHRPPVLSSLPRGAVFVDRQLGRGVVRARPRVRARPMDRPAARWVPPIRSTPQKRKLPAVSGYAR